MRLLRGHNERIRGLAYSPDGTELASCGSDWAVRLWDLATGAERLALRGHRRNVVGVAFGPNGRVVGSAGREPSLRFWDAATGDLLQVADPPDDRSGPKGGGSLAALLGGRPASFAPAAEVRAAAAAAWRLSRVRAHRLTKDDAARWRAARSMNALGRVALGHERGEFFELTAASQALCVFIPASTHGVFRGAFVPGLGFSLGLDHDLEVAFSPDGRTLALTAEKYAHLWDLDRRRLRILDGHDAAVWSLAFAPDGRTLATGGHDGTVRLWDVDDGAERACYDADIGIIDAVAFAPDGMTVAAGGKAGIAVWDVDAGGGSW